MQVTLDNNGKLTIIAQNGIEAYALKNWKAYYGGWENKSPCTLYIKCDPKTDLTSAIRVTINLDGDLTIIAVSEVEAYALQTWYMHYKRGEASLEVDFTSYANQV